MSKDDKIFKFWRILTNCCIRHYWPAADDDPSSEIGDSQASAADSLSGALTEGERSSPKPNLGRHGKPFPENRRFEGK